MSDEDIDRSILEAEAEVLPERELLSLISPDTSVGALPMPGLEDVESVPAAVPASDGTVPADAAGSAAGAERGTDDDRSEQISQSDSASAGT